MMKILSTTGMPNLKGGYIPLNKPRINSYKLTKEGYALLYLVERIKGEDRREQQEQGQKQQERE